LTEDPKPFRRGVALPVVNLIQAGSPKTPQQPKLPEQQPKLPEMQEPRWYALEAAFWKWVDENCPSKKPSERSAWMKENTFSYAGTTWSRIRTPHESNSRKTISYWTTTFRRRRWP
jgi:hypothetical protein